VAYTSPSTTGVEVVIFSLALGEFTMGRFDRVLSEIYKLFCDQ
jgi:hypothetical protein